MRIDDFDYSLPTELIAQRPLQERTASRLLYLSAAADAQPKDYIFSDIKSLLQPGDLLVLNDTRVFPARFYGQKASGGKVEVLLERMLSEQQALAHVRASKSPKPGSTLYVTDSSQITVLGREGDLFRLQLMGALTWEVLLEQVGHMPLPPYISRDDEILDQERYQTVFAQQPGAVAAPTAGLHFDEPLLEQLQDQGIDHTFITLHVGAGTFQPVRVDDIAEHKMHSERVIVSSQSCDKIAATKANGGKVVAVGTTVIRSLEAASQDGQIRPFEGETDLFITPGHRFSSVDMLLTNFHLPRSTLLMLVCAFAGYKPIMQAYQHAVQQQYRFFSYGDAMLLENKRQK